MAIGKLEIRFAKNERRRCRRSLKPTRQRPSLTGCDLDKVEALEVIATVQEARESEEVEDAERYSDLEAFWGAGVQSVLVRPMGLMVCHCTYYIRNDYCGGFWRPAAGCLRGELALYIICREPTMATKDTRPGREWSSGVNMGDVVVVGSENTRGGN